MKLNKKLIIGVIAIAAIFVSNLQYAIDNYGLGNWGLDFDIIASGSGSTGTGTNAPSGKDTHMTNCGTVERWDTHLCQWVVVQKYEGSCTTGTKPDCKYFSCTTDPDALLSSSDSHPDLPYDPSNPKFPNEPDATHGYGNPEYPQPPIHYPNPPDNESTPGIYIPPIYDNEGNYVPFYPPF